VKRLIYDDVPLHRPSVSAMNLTMGSRMPAYVTKPYIYRGVGVDTLTPDLGEDWERGKGKPEPATTTVKRTKSKPKRRPRRKSQWMRDKQERRREAAAARERSLIRAREAAVLAAADRRLLRDHGYDPEPEPLPPKPKHVQPAPGWEPTKGVDIDAWLEEYEVD
jgi:hypothetical protein